LAIASVFLM